MDELESQDLDEETTGIPDYSSLPAQMKGWSTRLSQYEEQREPHPILNDDVVIEIPWNFLNDQIKCPICLGIMNSPVSTMECLHRFCEQCISKALRYNKKECPTCRHPCPSRRSLRKDLGMEQLIAQIYPEPSDFEAQQEELMNKIKVNHNYQALVESIEVGMKAQAQNKVVRSRLSSSHSARRLSRSNSHPYSTAGEGSHSPKASPSSPVKVPPASPPPAADSSSTPVRRNEDDLVEVHMARHPQEMTLPDLSRPYLRTSYDCTIAHLIKYLAMKLSSSHPSAEEPVYQLSIMDDDGLFIRLQSTRGLRTTIATYGDSSRGSIKIYYSISGL